MVQQNTDQIADLIPAVVFASTLALLATRECIFERRNAELNRQSRQQGRLVSAQEHHGARFVIVDRGRSQVKNPRGLFSSAAKADETDNFALSGGEIMFCHD